METDLAGKPTLPEPNPITAAAHRRDFFRRVTLPVIIVLLLMIAAVVVFIQFQVGDVETWSQIATIFLLSLAILVGLLVLVLTAVLVYALRHLLKVLPSYTRLAQDGIEKIRSYAARGADIPVKPVIQVQSFIAAINAIFGRRK